MVGLSDKDAAGGAHGWLVGPAPPEANESVTPQMHLRLVYSLLKPAARMAARLSVPMRTLTELLRLATYEAHAAGGLSSREIGERMGQSSRNVRSYAKRMRGDFFEAETDVGLTRALEEAVARAPCTRDQLTQAFESQHEPSRIDAAVDALLEQGRLSLDEGMLKIGSRYAVLGSDAFHRRIDALNHFLDGAYLATVHRLIYDEPNNSMIKTITFSARDEDLQRFMKRLEGELRRELAQLEEQAAFSGASARRHTLGLTLSPREDGD